MEVKITTLSENSAMMGCLGEWGLSMLVEFNGLKILFDTGAGHAAVHNAQILGVDLAAVDLIVLSHGHHDHTGGLREVLRRTGPKPVIAHPDIWQRKYNRHKGEKERYIGIPFVREELESRGASFQLSREPMQIADGIMTTGEIPQVTEYEKIDEYLVVKDNGKASPDTFPDDLALIIDADFGRVVILGCAHRGMVNTLYHARQLCGDQPVYAVIGGTHLIHAGAERLALTQAALREIGVRYLGVSHCTGFTASMHLAQEFGETFFLNNSGNRFSLPF
ncbi:MBL fold metallo-hydrolase [Chloroflexota bacterium]